MRGMEEGKRVALLISECQLGVIGEQSLFPALAQQVRERDIVGKIAALAAQFRARGQSVVHLHVAHHPQCVDLPRTSLVLSRSVKLGVMRAGQPETASAPGLIDAQHDFVHVRRFSLVAFHGTDLDQTLRNMGVDTVVLAGVSSNIAIPGCALAASDYGYQVIVAEDCVAGASVQAHAFTMSEVLPMYAAVSDSAAIAQALPARV